MGIRLALGLAGAGGDQGAVHLEEPTTTRKAGAPHRDPGERGLSPKMTLDAGLTGDEEAALRAGRRGGDCLSSRRGWACRASSR